ncbi:hypothetical protein OF83DRAFT_1115271 [Amylostereum chailletii]|nr:hypothetical protein OF83DRAFT_1115271 [Amylostereum chailletii]
MLTLVFTALASTIICSTLFVVYSRSPSPQYPPGPRSFPFIGRAFDISPNEPEKTFAAWGKIYGKAQL